MSKKPWLASSLIVILGVIVYANSFGNPFIWDDANHIVSNPYIKDIRLIANLFTKDLGYGTQFSNFYRPLQSLSYELDYYLWGLNPFGFHLTNLLLHTACALLIYFLLSLIFPNLKLAPSITALLFLVHPIQTEAVTYISGRADSQAGLFMLLSLFFYIKHSRRPKNIFLSGAVISFIFALLSKETALILPLLILLYDLSFSKGRLSFRDKIKFRYSLFLPVALIYILLRSTCLNFLQRPLFLSNIGLYSRLLTSAKTFSLYLGLLILPLHLHMERSMPMVSSILDKDVLLSVILLIFLAILIVRSYRHSKVLFFAGLWFFVNLIPVSNIVPLNANMAEHWLYLPSIGFFLLIALGLDKLAMRAKPGKVLSLILLTMIICFYSFLTIKRNYDWKDPQSFFQTILCYSPQSVEAHNCLGAIYLEQEKFDLAIKEFSQAIKLNPQNYKLYGNLGSALRKTKEYDLAISAYKKALALHSGIPGLYNNLGNVYGEKGQWLKAKEIFQQALKLYPEFALCRVNLAKVYFSMGDIDLAVEEFKQAIALEPDLVLAHYDLARLYYSRGEYNLAIEQYKKVLNIAPAHFRAYHNLGVVYFKKRNFSLAKENFLQALSLNPQYNPSREFLKKMQ